MEQNHEQSENLCPGTKVLNLQNTFTENLSIPEEVINFKF